MNERYRVGDYGEMSFVQVFKKHSLRLECGKIMFGTIMETDPRFIRFQDNDGFEYLIEKIRIRKFDKAEKPIIVKAE